MFGKSPGQLWLCSMGVVLALAGMAFTYLLWATWQVREQTRSWKAHPCTILTSQLHRDEEGRYLPEVRYRYEQEGKGYESTRISLKDTPHRDEEKAQEIRMSYRPGQQLSCFLRPGHPEQSVLRHQSRAPLYAIWFPMMFIYLGGVMALRAWHGEGRHRLS
jgi:hypothetical protein